MNNWYAGLKELIFNADSYDQFEAIETILNILVDDRDINNEQYKDLHEMFEMALFIYQKYNIAKGMNL